MLKQFEMIAGTAARGGSGGSWGFVITGRWRLCNSHGLCKHFKAARDAVEGFHFNIEVLFF